MTDQEQDAKTRSATSREEESSAPTTPADSASAAATPEPSKKSEERRGAPILLYRPSLCNRKCEPVVNFGKNLEHLVQVMYDTIAERGGIGLAAPQIAVFDRVCLIHHPDCQRVMINPEILTARDRNTDWEACLSLPGYARNRMVNNRARVTRFEIVEIKYQDVDGKWHEEKLRDYPARIAQHELDHLEGKFFIHHAKKIARELVLEKLANFVKMSAQVSENP